MVMTRLLTLLDSHILNYNNNNNIYQKYKGILAILILLIKTKKIFCELINKNYRIINR